LNLQVQFNKNQEEKPGLLGNGFYKNSQTTQRKKFAGKPSTFFRYFVIWLI